MATVVSIAPYPFLPARIGGQKGIALFNKYFGRYVQLICLTVGANDNSLASGYQALTLFSNSWLRYINPLNFFKVRHILKKTIASHLLIEHPYFGWLGVLLKRFTSVRLIVHSHNIESTRFKTIGKWWWKILWFYERWTHKNADYNFFIHESDLSYAVRQFGLDPSKCLVVTYGIERNSIPARAEIEKAREFVMEENKISNSEKILFFNGSFNYKPNVDALQVIAEIICPLLDELNFSYKVIVCGPWLPDISFDHPNLQIKGYVDSIEPYFLGADVFINPVMDGGGIKTKLVEALGYNCNAVSTIDGATGIDPSLCNGKLLLAGSGSWPSFAKAIIMASENKHNIPPEFYSHFYWGYNTQRAAEFIENTSTF